MVKLTTLCWALATAAVTVGLPMGAAAQQRDAVVKAWQERQDRFRTVHIRSEGEYLDPRASISRLMAPIFPKDFGANEVPPHDHSFGATQSMALAENKYRYELQGVSVWSVSDKAFSTQDWVTAFDGKTARSTVANSARSHRQGAIKTIDRPADTGLVAVYPIMVAFRPLHAQLRSFDIGEFAAGGTALIGGRQCRELTKRVPSQQHLTSIWLDPGREYVMTRMRTQVNNVLLGDIEVEYQQDANHGWVPKSWRIANYAQKGNLFKSEHHKVTSYEINESLDDKIFTIDFEARTYIVDEDRHEHFVVRNDGSTRPVAPQDHGKPFEELAKANSRLWKKPYTQSASSFSLAVPHC